MDFGIQVKGVKMADKILIAATVESKDAERIDWLEKNLCSVRCNNIVLEPWTVIVYETDISIKAETLRKAIDKAMQNELFIVCFKCGKRPEDLEEYVDAFEANGDYYESPNDYVIQEEGTFNKATNTFCCTDCYVAIGMPVGANGRRLVAPERQK